MNVPESWHRNKKAGADWFTGFSKRHASLSIKKPVVTSVARSTSLNSKNSDVSRGIYIYQSFQSIWPFSRNLTCIYLVANAAPAVSPIPETVSTSDSPAPSNSSISEQICPHPKAAATRKNTNVKGRNRKSTTPTSPPFKTALNVKRQTLLIKQNERLGSRNKT